MLLSVLHRDPVRAPGDKGAEEHYDLSDALGAPRANSTCFLVFVKQDWCQLLHRG